jgi:hypothetical protein
MQSNSRARLSRLVNVALPKPSAKGKIAAASARLNDAKAKL